MPLRHAITCQTFLRVGVTIAVFAMMPIGAAHAAWSQSTLWSFNGTDGCEANASLVFDKAGNLYGTAPCGGKFGEGVVFKLAKPAAGKSSWTQALLHSFQSTGTDGQQPYGNLAIDPAGNLFGTTGYGGRDRNGVVFKLAPPAAGKATWTKTTLLFLGGNSGSDPGNDLLRDAAGNLYGTTTQGRTSEGQNYGGAVFKLAPPTDGRTSWTATVIYRFLSLSDGDVPAAGLILGAAGTLYGTTAYGGASSDGNVFELIPPTAGKTLWTEKVLHSFNGADGKWLYCNLVRDRDGNLYGTTNEGGANNAGTVFELSPPAAGKSAWTRTVLHYFTKYNKTDGAGPVGGLVMDKAGNLYGTTGQGGKFNLGTVFELAHPAGSETSWAETLLLSFNGPNGKSPQAGLIFDAKGDLYGTTSRGGAFSEGTVFKLTP